MLQYTLPCKDEPSYSNDKRVSGVALGPIKFRYPVYVRALIVYFNIISPHLMNV
jgi:hypothetical protein